MRLWKARTHENDVAARDQTNDYSDGGDDGGDDGGAESGTYDEIGGPDDDRTGQIERRALHQSSGISTLPLPQMLSSWSHSRRAVHVMNVTSGLCADPVHYHSFACVGGSDWPMPSPRALLVGAFERCAACGGRMGGTASAVAEETVPSGGMLRCVACGVYAHRSCAFSRRRAVRGRSGGCDGGGLPPCEANLVEIRRAFGLDEECSNDDELADSTHQVVEESRSKSSPWSIFGIRSPTPGQKKEEDDDSLLEEKKEPEHSSVDVPKPTDPAKPPSVIETSFQLIKKTSETTKKIPTASAIGMVAGGAAGLAIAGPAGCVVGSQIGRTVLAVGAAVEGGWGISVLVMNLAAAANFSGASSSNGEREVKLSSKLVLVRPDVEVDPLWGNYADEARKSWVEKHGAEKSLQSSSCGSFGLGHLFSPGGSKKEEPSMRYRKDSDIIKADATELPMREKVFLLVNRILNDKTSLPGYQYRCLVLKHKRRTMFGAEGGSLFAEGEDRLERSCRRDAHGVIKHVTATLLEVRPGLSASPAMTELSASAVEVLVFGELYEDVFGEIIRQTEPEDEGLLNKVRVLREKQHVQQLDTFREGAGTASVSRSAIAALGSMPRAHTPTDKLSHCVEFLECVSDHFSTLFEGRCIDADTLLVMVCQHVVAAGVDHLHAEVAFIEEFSRDEQLMSGKEGYALITLQASLHYLDSLEALPSDLHIPSDGSRLRTDESGEA